MLTYADLFIKAIQLLTGERTRLIALRRDQRDRVADFLQHIGDGLAEAASAFVGNARPWGVCYELSAQVDHLVDVVGKSFGDAQFAEELRLELRRALASDHILLNISERHVVADAITIRPEAYIWAEDWKDNPLALLSEQQVQSILDAEVRKLYEASGLFRAASHRLRATHD